MFTARYETLLVIASILVAILASYTALDMAGRINSASKKKRFFLVGRRRTGY
ncbi:MAG: hypothetical protein K2X63_04475 [Burkholderiaceae bacterium]|jgi:NO-binding membrane sensor protein with MHYT domain|nr:hypothetical protein [Burkholderiaceae bacterium]